MSPESPQDSANSPAHTIPQDSESHRSSSILVVDDDPDICANLADILSDFGFEVESTTDPLTAIELTKEKGFDLTILDYQLPGMNGVELYRRLKQTRNDTTAIIITAYAATETQESAKAEGVDTILNKPIDVQQLVEVIDSETNRPTMMIVDDDHDLCESLKDLIHSETGLHVGIANSAESAEHMLKGRNYRAVLVDLKLQDDSGTRVVEIVQKETPNTEIILITGYQHEFEREIVELQQSGVQSICYKPFNVEELIRSIVMATSRS